MSPDPPTPPPSPSDRDVAITSDQGGPSFEHVTSIVRDRLARNVRIRRNLPGRGRLRIDRQLPFLCVHRRVSDHHASPALHLVTTEAAYLVASGTPEYARGVSELVHMICDTLLEHFGTFLIIEVWQDDALATRGDGQSLKPAFRVVAAPGPQLSAPITALSDALSEITVHGLQPTVEVDRQHNPAAPQLPPLLNGPAPDNCFWLGIAVKPVYEDAGAGAFFPLVLQTLRRQLARAIRRAVFTFSGKHGEGPHRHFEALGPSALVKATRLTDQLLSEVSQSFDFILQTVPINSHAAWREFEAERYSKDPALFYRPLPYHPTDLKRRLLSAPIEHIEDATLMQLMEQKQDRLDRQITALKHIDTPEFLYDSLQLYPAPDADLLKLAQDLLARLADRPLSKAVAQRTMVTGEEIAAAAREEIDYYHLRLPDFLAAVELRDDLAASMMVVQGRLLVSSNATMDRRVLRPLLHHEVGTHLVTYFNGRQQPLGQLSAGLAGYESLQEGLAVLAEYAAGGLTASRLRTLACRVLAVDAMLQRRSFVETFDMLHGDHGLPARSAFMTTLRAYRGGGLTKDAIYLAGLRDLHRYLAAGHKVAPLYVGKIAFDNIPLVQDLRRRDVIVPPALLPRFWEDPVAQERLERFRQTELLDLTGADL